MDVNGTRCFLRLGAVDWEPQIAAGSDIEWDPTQASLRLRARPFRFTGPPGAAPPGIAARRGAAWDAFGTWYWIREDRRGLRYWSSGQESAGDFWAAAELTHPVCPVEPGADFQACAPAPLAAPPLLCGLAVSRDQYLLVGTLDPAGLLVFDLHAGGLPVWQRWPADFRPWDLAADAEGGVWILDTDPREPNGDARLRQLDSGFSAKGLGGLATVPAPAPDLFQPVNGAARPPRTSRPEPLPLPLAGIAADPVALEHLAEDAVLLLDNPLGAAHSLLVLVSATGQTAVSLAGALDGLDIRAHDLAFVADAGGRAAAAGGTLSGTLFLVAESGNQAFAFVLRAELGDTPALELTLLHERYYPMRRFAGRALAAAGGTPYYDIGERWVPLTEQPQPMFEPLGETAPLRLDSEIPGCRWHRLTLDACIPNGAAVAVETRAADDSDLLPLLPWDAEPTPYLRTEGSELPWHRPFPDADVDGQGTWETLLQQAQGRWLELRLRLTGTGRNSPCIRALRVHAPRFSYLDAYLPAVYREDEESAGFLDRWLANPEGLLTTLEGRIAATEVLLDARTAPPDYLEWLAGWLGAVQEPDWDEPRRRLFLEHAATLFGWRGTPSGLLAAIRLAIDPCPDAGIFADLGRSLQTDAMAGYRVRIIEGHQERRLPGVVLGNATAGLLPAASAAGERWQPSQGSARLHHLYRDDLSLRYPDGAGGLARSALGAAWEMDIPATEQLRFPPLRPEHPVQAVDWRGFVGRWLGLPYAEVGPDDLAAWQCFLAARYPSVADMNLAYGRPAAFPPAGFGDVILPAQLPAGRSELADWIAFVSLALPIRRQAHRFTVLVPSDPGEPAELREARLARVRAVVQRERPAHTNFEVKLYWALFRVGTARLGLDTVLGEGSRYTAIVLAASHLAEGYLAEFHPWDVRDRWVAGRDPITITPINTTGSAEA